MNISYDPTLNKLVLLALLDKMDFPIFEDNILHIVSQSNNWVSWMECKEALGQLLEASFVHKTIHEKKGYFSITPDGRECLKHFYTKVPAAIRADITEYTAKNRLFYKRRQEYSCTYFRNADGSYTVEAKINSLGTSMLTVKLTVASRDAAKQIYEKWETKAATIYTLLHEQLVE